MIGYLCEYLLNCGRRRVLPKDIKYSVTGLIMCTVIHKRVWTISEVAFNRSWRISTTPNTTKIFLIILKLIQQSIMVILSCLAKKNQNLNSRKKSSVYYWKLRFQGRNACKLPFLVINWTFFPRIQILIFLPEATQNNHIRLLSKFGNDQKNLVLLGAVDTHQLLLKTLLNLGGLRSGQVKG